MAPAEFKGLVPPSKTKHEDHFDVVSFFVKDAFSLRSLMVMGALVQILLSSTLQPRVALLPAGLLTLYGVLDFAIQLVRSPNNFFMRSVILGRTSAQLPDPGTGSFGSKAAAHPIVVFHFGVRFNRPLGVLSPGARGTIDHFTACNNSVIDRADEYGMLGVSPWRAAGRGKQDTLMMVYYLRDIDGLHKFAHDEIHRKAWDWLAKAGH